MALPVGLAALGSFQGKEGKKGDTGSLAFADGEVVGWDQPFDVEMIGPESNRGAYFKVPLPLPGPETVNNDDATELLVLNPTKSRAALLTFLARRVDLDVRDFGAKGDGVSDDTAAIQAAVDAAGDAGGGDVRIPDGTFMVNPRAGYTGGEGIYHDGGGVRMRDGVFLRLTPRAVIKAFPQSTSIYKVVQFRRVRNAGIVGGTIQGERADHVGSGGEHGMCVAVLGSSNITVSDVTTKDGWGDGVLVTYLPVEGELFPLTPSRDVTTDRVVSDNNRRQGLSIIGVTGMVVDGCVFQNTNGALPSAGIDIEPNAGFADVRDVTIRNTQLLDNARAGLNIYGTGIFNITVEDVLVRGNGHETAQILGNARANSVTFSRVTVEDSTVAAVSLAEFQDLQIVGCTFDSDLLIPYAAGYRSGSCTGLVIERNRIYGSVKLSHQWGAKISKNHIEPSSSQPCIDFIAGVACRDTEISGNVFEGGAYGVDTTVDPTATRVLANTFSDQRTAAIRLPQQQIEIRGNHFHSCTLDVVDGSVLVRDDSTTVQWIDVLDNTFYAAPRNPANAGGKRPRYAFGTPGQVFQSRYQRNLIRAETGYTTTAFRDDLVATNQSVFAASGEVPARATTHRPTNAAEGQQFFDTTIGKPIWRAGSVWKDAAGVTV